MIVVRIELWSAVDRSVTELARMHLCNDGEASVINHRRGDYVAQTFIGRDTAALDRGQVSKSTKIVNWPRLDKHLWNLVQVALTGMGYGK